MRAVGAPKRHLFVCTNRRPENDPLGAGCGGRGEALYDELKREVAMRGAVRETWITRTHCLGVCPKHGATVARYQASAERGTILADAVVADAALLLDGTSNPDPESQGVRDIRGGLAADELERELTALEKLQGDKVLALARRLKPGLTLEDVQNPHDFPELDDKDWHYADGVLTGIKTATTALRALIRRS